MKIKSMHKLWPGASANSEKNNAEQEIHKKERFLTICIYTLLIVIASSLMLLVFNILIRLR
jgi:hypothetical protein